MITIHFERFALGAYETWDLECDTLHEARELAQEFVDEGDADRARIEHGWREEQYDHLGWSAY